jgi:hypothetical protein
MCSYVLVGSVGYFWSGRTDRGMRGIVESHQHFNTSLSIEEPRPTMPICLPTTHCHWNETGLQISFVIKLLFIFIPFWPRPLGIQQWGGILLLLGYMGEYIDRKNNRRHFFSFRICIFDMFNEETMQPTARRAFSDVFLRNTLGHWNNMIRFSPARPHAILVPHKKFVVHLF